MLNLSNFAFPFNLDDMTVLSSATHIQCKGGIPTGIHGVDIQTLHEVQTQHWHIKVIFLTCFNLNKASVLP